MRVLRLLVMMRVLLAIDDSPCSEAAIRAVLSQFGSGDAEIHVLHVDEWPKGLSNSLRFAEGPQAANDVISIHDEIRRRASSLVTDVAQRLNAAGLRATTETRQGDARHAILDCADEWRPDLIVVGSHGRTGLSRFALGSVSDGVMRHARCSVEVVRERR